jgi:hypothetical protein
MPAAGAFQAKLATEVPSRELIHTWLFART